ncbi:MAG: bifunctional folylpolyglutamate synthase/dihydrofolate synthase [Deltaproteobacteria bacterium]|jgi:dihydrofolate synthase/folylpolyglutamate synthase|nr:bifunctional folylpolyglutamate synthase/dihydrofolate synthase [Deltaproteobacteria bacterium]
MASKDTYKNCLKTMYGLRRFGIILGLETIQRILDGLGSPHQKYTCIHVAGTNGKGSVAATLASILFESGYAVGLYTSPHLVRFNERICINNRQISDDDVVRAYRAVKRVHYGERSPTFFEFTTAMALYAFKQHRVDYAVIETGMGGRYDATNVIQPAISIITNVSLEHRDYLGNTLAEIAREKAGIIKQSTPVVTGVKQKQVCAVVQQVARKKKAPLFMLGKAFKVTQHHPGQFSYTGCKNKWRTLQTPLLGRYQVQNAALALAACELLINDQVAITIESIKKGLANTRWPGRLEIVCEYPLVILDGAHNLIAARNLAKYLAENLAGRRITLVIGILDDKPYRSMLNSLLPECSRVIITRAQSQRALKPEKLYAVAKKTLSEVSIISDVAAAVRNAIETAGRDDVVCVAGSLYVVGEAKEAIEKGLLKSTKK